MMKKFPLPALLLALCGLVFSGPGWSAEAAPAVERYVLNNGLTVIVKPDRRAPTAVHMLWLRVGSVDEHNGSTGISHVLEHMLFKGSEQLAPAEFSRRVAALGGQDNAFTSTDYTGYFQQVPASRLPDVMALQAEVFAHALIDAEELARELEVIKEERRLRTDDNPRAILREQQMATVFMQSPYHHPIVGWMADLDDMQQADVRAWYQRWYVPENAALIVVGDVNPEQVLAWVRQYYGVIPARALPQRKRQPEGPQLGLRRIEVKQRTSQSVVSLAFRVPGLDGLQASPDNDDVLALSLLAGVLDGYEGARLSRALTQGEDRVADSVSANNGLVGRGPQLFTMSGVLAPGHSADELEQALRAQVRRVADEGVTEQELKRVKTQWIASQIYKQDSVMGQAQELGFWWAMGLPVDADERLIARLEQVSAQQVQDVARRYFGDEGLTVAVLRPLDAEADEGAPQEEAEELQ